MKKITLIVAMCILAAFGVKDIAKAQEDTRSIFNAGDPGKSTTPKAFTEIGNPKANPAISTGYYFMDDSEEDTYARWKPVEKKFDSTGNQPFLWRKIYSGPRQVPISERAGTPNEGKIYFRNPADSAHYFNISDKTTPIDSVNASIAGPISLGFAFYFNGIRYDSFYVSPKGLIALTNRRYFYDNNGQRVKPAGMADCYDPMSSDWFAAGRARVGDGLSDATPDDYGYKFVASGGNLGSKYAGIRRGVTVTDAQNFTNAGHNQFLSSFVAAVPGGAYLAPFYGPFYLPQYDSIRKRTDAYGEVWYKRSLSSDKLLIYMKNLTALPGTYRIGPNDNYNIPGLGRPGLDNNQLSGSCQVILNRRDSSITYLYGEFKGNVQFRNIMQLNAAQVYMSPFALVGVGGYARHTNYNSKTQTEAPIWAAEYPQVTEQQPGSQNPASTQNVFAGYFSLPDYRIKFKQWRNALRLVDVQYLVRKKDINSDLNFTEAIRTEDVQDQHDPFELFAGEERLGSMQPVAVVQNLTNEIQGSRGVNFVKQDFQFQARFRVRNVAFDTYIYNRVAKVYGTCLRLAEGDLNLNCSDDPYASVRYVSVTKQGANYVATDKALVDGQDGIPPYEFARIRFSKFEPNQYIDDHIGIMEAQAITEARNPVTNEYIGDDWPFDDSSNVKFWVLRRIRNFKDNVSDLGFYDIEGIRRPSVIKWVHNSDNGPIVEGADAFTDYPMPPIGRARAANDTLYTRLNSPSIQMNWNPNPDETKSIGDKITSFPIDLRNQNGSILTLSVQRGKNTFSTKRGFSDGSLVGAEHRAVFMDNLGGITPYISTGDVPSFDYLAVEFLKPSPDGILKITNTGNDNIKDNGKTTNALWRYHPVWRNGVLKDTLTGIAPALAVYGGGGYFIGWDYSDKRTYKPVNWETTVRSAGKSIAGVIFNPYDAGYDYEFYKYSVVIPDYYIDGAFDGGKNFRFRIRVVETNEGKGDNKGNQFYPTDLGGDDVFYVDNVAVISKSDVPDIEMSAVKVIWPYTVVPASQGNDLDVIARFANISSTDAKSFGVKVKIFKGSNTNAQPVYCKTITQASMKAGVSTEMTFPQFNARNFADFADGSNTFTLQAMVLYKGGDLDASNDTTTSRFVLTFGPDFAYDVDASNEVGEEVGITGKGLNLLGATFHGYNQNTTPNNQTINTPKLTTGYKNYYSAADPSRPWIDYVAGGSLSMLQFFPDYPGPIDGALSGQIAVKFVLSASDTIRGFKANFSEANQAFDDISFNVYSDAGGRPGVKIGSTLYGRRLLAKNINEAEAKEPVVGAYVLYELPEGIALNKGTYWASIAQRGETGLELSASGQRMAMVTTVVQAAQNGILGGAGIQHMVDKRLRVPSMHPVYGYIYENNNIFAFENILNSGNWTQFMPTQGQVAYAHFDHYGTRANPNNPAVTFRTLTRATWLPLIRPYFGLKTVDPDTSRYPCPDDIASSGGPITPVELTAFNGIARENSIELMWETASEINNYGFLVEKSIDGTDWSKLTFEKGAGNSNTVRRYKFNDDKVVSGETYQYRLQQMDYDGTLACNANIIKVKYENVRDIVLSQNNPNPFSDVTYIDFFMPRAENIKLEVVDIFGNVVRTIANETRNSGDVQYSWNGKDAAGNKVATGSYVVRLTVGDNILTKKMSYIRNN